MIAAMVDIHEMRKSVLVVVIEPANLDRMKNADPATLESISQGGILRPPVYPLNLSTIIAYEADEIELYTKAKGDVLVFLRYLERGRRFIEGLDGVENTITLRTQRVTPEGAVGSVPKNKQN